MRSIKTKLFSLAMAVSMVLALAGCAMSTPSTVGSIGGVEIPAGIYRWPSITPTTPRPVWPSLRPARQPPKSKPC